jgi:hypothetical protein
MVKGWNATSATPDSGARPVDGTRWCLPQSEGANGLIQRVINLICPLSALGSARTAAAINRVDSYALTVGDKLKVRNGVP